MSRCVSHRCQVAIFGFVLALAGMGPTHAADYYWTNTPSGNFTNPVNWTAGIVPGIADNAWFTNRNGTFAVSLTSVQTNATARVEGTDGTVVLGVASDARWVLTSGLIIGSNAASSTLFLTGGVVEVSGGLLRVGPSTSSSNTLVVTGPGAILTNSGSGYMGVGESSSAKMNSVVVTNGGRLLYGVGGLWMGTSSGSTGNSILVAGSNSLLQGGGTLYPGFWGGGNSLVVSNGGRVVTSGGTTMGNVAGGISNQVIVTGSGSLLTNYGGNFGMNKGAYQTVLVEKGGRLMLGSANNFILGGSVEGSNNTVVVRDDGSLLSAGTFLSIGSASAGNRLVVRNGAQAVAGSYVQFGIAAGADNNSAWVTGPGSLLKGTRIYVGTNSLTKGINASVLIENGGILESTWLEGGYAGSGNISNIGGIYRFTASPTVVTNGSVILLHDGAVEIVGVGNAVVQSLFPMTFVGTNALRLISSTNFTLATFSVGSGQNFQELQLVGTNPRWVGTSLLVTNGGTLVVSNASGATVAPVVTSLGAVRVVNSRVTFESAMLLSGSYLSDPSTNIFANNLTVTASGSLAGGSGDLFDFKKSLIINSTTNNAFDLDTSKVMFSGGGNHTNAVTGGDFGTNVFASVGNFGYGRLTLASPSDQLYFISGGWTNGGASSNALYVRELALYNGSSVLDTNLVANLHSSFNIYYLLSEHSVLNAYLNDQTYGLSGGGFLIPVVPEPSSLLLAVAGSLLLACRRKKRTHF